jgi:hypothetical protein
MASLNIFVICVGTSLITADPATRTTHVQPCLQTVVYASPQPQVALPPAVPPPLPLVAEVVEPPQAKVKAKVKKRKAKHLLPCKRGRTRNNPQRICKR